MRRSDVVVPAAQIAALWRSQCALGPGRGRHAQTPFPCDAHDARGQQKRLRLKVREWNRTALVERCRERWAGFANQRLAELDLDARIDHRGFIDQGIGLEPQSQTGAPVQRIAGEGSAADRADLHREIARSNGERIIAAPSLSLEAITHQQSTFTEHDMARFAHRHSDGMDQFNAVRSAMRTAPDLVPLGTDAA